MTTTALQRALCAREGFAKNKRYLLSAAVSMIYNSSGGGGGGWRGREFWSKFFIKNDEMNYSWPQKGDCSPNLAPAYLIECFPKMARL